MSLSRSEPSRHRPAGKKLPSAPTQKPANPLGSAHAPRRPPPAGLSPRAEKQKRRPQQGGISQKIGGGSAPLRGCSQSGRQAERDFLRKRRSKEAGGCFSCKEKRSKTSFAPTWRRDGDSNPRSRFNGLHDFQSCSFDQLGHLSIEYCIFRTPDYYIQIIVECQGKNAKFHKKLTRK